MSWVARAPGIGPARCESNCRDARLSKESRPQNPSDHQQTISHEDLPCARLARRVPNPVTGRLRLRRSRVASPSHRAGGGPGGARQREEDRAGDADGSDGEGLPKAEAAGWERPSPSDPSASPARMGKAFRKLKKQVGDPAQNATSLELLSAMEAAAKEAIELTPAKAEDIPEDQRAKFEADFQSGIKNLQDMFAKLRDALTAGRNDDAAKLVDDIGAFEKKEHKEYRRPEKD